jgi:hypothetical protein
VKQRFVAMAMVFAAAATATAACGGGGGSGGTVEGFCAELNTDNAIFKTLGNTASDSDQAVRLFEDLVKKAPSEIKAEMDTLAKFLKGSIQAASDFSTDPSASRSSSRDAEISAQSSSLEAASKKLATFAKDKCHIDLGASSASSKFDSIASSINN